MDLLITVASLFVAIYAVVPRNRQLDLQLRLGGLDWVVLAGGSSIVVYLQFYDFFRMRGLSVSLHGHFRGITPHDAIYLVILLMILWLGIHIRFSRLSPRKIGKFRELAEELYWAGTYGELFALLQEHCNELFKIFRADLILVRIREKMNVDPLQQMRALLSGDDVATADRSIRERIISFATPFLAKVTYLLPSYEREQNIARDLVRMLFLSERLVGPLSTTRPYFALDVIHAWSNEYGRFDFIDLFVKELLKDSTSIFYLEIRNNQNISSNHRYYIAESNRFLYFFLANAQVAYDNEIYRPVGDYTLSLLDQLGRDPATDTNCLAMDHDFQEFGAWHSPLFAAIQFFDIMVSEALYQGIEWHMWLYYFPPIIEKVVRNYRSNDILIEPESEWPTRYSYLIYKAFDAMCSWIKAVSDIDPQQSNVVLHSLRAEHDNGNIPKSAILALSLSLREVLQSTGLDDNFKAYIADIAFCLYFDLRSSSNLEGYATVLREALGQGGTYGRRRDENYRSALLRAFGRERHEYGIKYRHEYVVELETAIMPRD